MLFRAFHTDNYLTYSAISTTTAHMGQQEMKSVARIIHAPQKLSITYQSGALAGVSMGYNQHWTWRKAVSQPMTPYAEMERPTEEMAAQRFALMLKLPGALGGQRNAKWARSGNSAPDAFVSRRWCQRPSAQVVD